MIQLALQEEEEDADWLAARPWEMSQSDFCNFPQVMHAITAQVHAWLATTEVQVRYLWGMDHALKCGLLQPATKEVPVCSSVLARRFLLVALGRPGRRLGLDASALKAYEEQGILVLEDEDLFLQSDTADASSTAIRRALSMSSQEQQQTQGALAFLCPLVKRYLCEHALDDDLDEIYQGLADTQGQGE